MGTDREYKITFVEARPAYDSKYGRMQPYALKFEGVDGYVQLSQKPETAAPEEGQTLYGHLYEQNSAKGTFLKFKKVNPEFAGQDVGSKPTVAADNEYHTELLEAIAEAVGAGAAVKRKDTVLDDIDGDPIDLSEIPF